MPQYMEMRLRQANPANLDAFFTDLQRIWLESRGRIAEQQPSPSQTLVIQPQKDSQAEHDFIVRLTKDLDYLGVATNLSVLGPHIYDELGKRLGRKTAHVRKSPFTPKNVEEDSEDSEEECIAEEKDESEEEEIEDDDENDDDDSPLIETAMLVMENDTVKRRELAWENVTRKVQEVLFPLMQATNAEQKLLL
ncbi:unnamed protein product [Rhizophagus irregularis]|uniref:Uncharacterized protein n=1 Tax=Rhizophagus irregularis TaxID=588596 RepID=A0A916ECC1_9GLOM|nr:unnamed protein product [Rhizophagus irregularis]